MTATQPLAPAQTPVEEVQEFQDSDSARPSRSSKPFLARIPWYAWAGLALNVAAWVMSWARIGEWNGLTINGYTYLGAHINLWAYTFFPIWLGFILVLDGVNVARSGSSPLVRSWRGFILLFLLSIPFWWVFEILNIPVQNWRYFFDHPINTNTLSGWIEYHTISSLCFSTVLPAVLEIAEILASFAWLRPRLAPHDPGPKVKVSTAIILMLVGIAGLILPFTAPYYAFGLLWVGVTFLLDPINNLARTKSALGHLLAGDWRFFVLMPLAALCCGFFWEMWNSQALPKWIYTISLIESWHIPHLFEMPVIGYSGYLPFGVELFVMYQFALLLLRRRKDVLTF
ncbi:MAG TPA: hypothetical protein VH591_18140 [Ktedonobacterales bacterium]|jgi:hypothetical protein